MPAREQRTLNKIRLVDSHVADHLRSALRATRTFLHRAAEPVHGVKAENRFWMQWAQTRRDLVEQQLPDLSVRQSGEPLCQHGGNQQNTSEPLHGVVRVHKLSLLFDEFPDRQSLPPLQGYEAPGQIGRRSGSCYRRFASKPGRFFLLLRILQLGEQ